MSSFLTMSSVIQCPHGGVVTAVPSNTKAQAQGALILCATDVFTVAGCSIPVPCVTVTWPAAVHKSKPGGNVCLTQSDQGITNNGSIAVIVYTQSQAGAS
jgi:hypothetical protein